MPSIKNTNGPALLTLANISINTSGDNTIIAAPGAGLRIVISELTLINESSTATTVLLKSGSTIFHRMLFQNQGNGALFPLAKDREWRLGANEAFVINLSGANAHGGGVSYIIENIS